MLGALSQVYEEPRNLNEVKRSPDRIHWEAAMRREFASLQLNGTFTPALPGSNSKPLSSKWVFKRKNGPSGLEYKARLVVRGFAQEKGRDYDDTYASVAKTATLRLLIAIAAKLGLKMHHMDVTTAFLNPAIDRQDIFVRLPKGTDDLILELDIPTIVRLLKALYGLKQSPYLWHNEITAFLLLIGMTQSQRDPNLFFGRGVLLLLYVDDFFILDLGIPGMLDNLKKRLMDKYRIKDLGEAKIFLGLELNALPNGDVHLGQMDYIKKILNRYKMDNCKPVSSPMCTTIDLDNPACEDKLLKELDKNRYQSMVGALMYASLGSRPDISFAVAKLCRYNSRPTTTHMMAARRVFKYLQGSIDTGVVYSGPNTAAVHPVIDDDDKYARWLVNKSRKEAIPLMGFTDSDWGGCL